MISDAVIDALAATIQAGYTGAGSDVEVLADWPDPLYEPDHPLLILHEMDEVDFYISNGRRGQQESVYDMVGATYRQLAITEQKTQPTLRAAQRKSRADKMILADLFVVKPALTLGETVLEAGKMIRVKHPAMGPYETGSFSGSVRFTWSALIAIRTHVHPNP